MKKYITGTHKELLRNLLKEKKLNQWEASFVTNIIKFRKYSHKQEKIVNKILRKNNLTIPDYYTEKQIKELNSLYKDRNIIKNKQHMTSWSYKDRFSYRK